MNKIKVLEWIIDGSIKPSTKIDFLHFVYCDKPAVRLVIDSALEKSTISEWCEQNNKSLVIDRHNYACVANTAEYAIKLLELDAEAPAHEYELGILLGYPECCCEFIASVGEDKIDLLEEKTRDWNFTKEFELIRPNGYRDGSALICHIPCSERCKPSLEQAKCALSVLTSHREVVRDSNWKKWLYR